MSTTSQAAELQSLRAEIATLKGQVANLVRFKNAAPVIPIAPRSGLILTQLNPGQLVWASTITDSSHDLVVTTDGELVLEVVT